MNWEVGIDIYTINTVCHHDYENLLSTLGNSTQCSVVS